jgi:hypothetical protein
MEYFHYDCLICSTSGAALVNPMYNYGFDHVIRFLSTVLLQAELFTPWDIVSSAAALVEILPV